MKPITYILLTAMLIISIGCSSSNYLDDSDYSPPTIKYQPRLIYPTIAQENSLQGKAVVLLKISDQGKVVDTRISATSGYQPLDEAALDFCNNIVFNPAIHKSKPIVTQLRMGIDFCFDENEYDPKQYISNVNTLYKNMYGASLPKKYEYQKQVLAKHIEFVHNIKDAVNFNSYISYVIDDDIIDEWQDVWNSWPLSFLLYHDFLTRYNDFDDSAKVKMQMYSALKEDVKYIRKSPNNVNDKEVILGKIMVFMKSEYPELNLDSISFELDQNEVPNI